MSKTLGVWIGVSVLAVCDVVMVNLGVQLIPATDADGRTGAVVVGVIALVLLGIVGWLVEVDNT